MFTNIQKIATIYACIRETTDEMFREEKEDEGEEKEDEGEEKEDDGEEKEDEEASDEKFTVTASDVEAAYSFVKQSMITFRCFKVGFHQCKIVNSNFCFLQSTLDQEMGEDEHESKEVDEEEVIMAAADKIRKIYEKADENHQVCMGSCRSNAHLYIGLPILSYILTTKSDHLATLRYSFAVILSVFRCIYLS